MRRHLFVLSIATCFIIAPALANPVNPVVINGAASFNQTGNVLAVTNSNGAIINWDKFSINAGETTRFLQTSTSSSVLNRVLLNNPTTIYGTLSSNGRVWLVNPAGIMVGPGGRVDVAGFVASTLNIRNQDFLAGRNLFINDGTAKYVINHGEIKTPTGGSVYLVGSNVSNEGLITTPQGETILAAGVTVSLIDSATPGVKVDITGAAGNATNLGEITAEAGRIGIAGVIVRNSGTLNASSVVNDGGRIFLKASKAVTLETASEIKADAGQNGAGGNVLVWGDESSTIDGTLSARGGNRSGNGGFVETSAAHVHVLDSARITTAAAHGSSGTWLIDPNDYTIAASGGDITGATLSTNLGSGNVTLQSSSGATAGNGDVFVNDNIAWSANTTLTLSAARNVALRADISATGTGAGLTLNSNLASVGGASNLTGAISLNGGALRFGGGPLNLLNGSKIVGGTLTSTDGSLVLAPTNQTGWLDSVVLDADATISDGAILRYDNSLTIANGHKITLASTGSDTWLSGGTVGAQLLATGGLGEVVFGGTSANNYAVEPYPNYPYATNPYLLTIGPNVLIHGAGSGTIGYLNTLINQGTIQADGSSTISLYVTDWTNTASGVVRSNGGTINLAGNWTNNGTLNVASGTLNLGGNFATSGLGNLVGTGGATRLTGTLTNAGSTLTLNNTTGNIDIVGTVTGGTLATASGSTSKYLSTSGTLDGVTLAGNLQVNPNGNMTIRNGLTLSNGKVYLGDGVTNAASGMNWDGTQTIGGSGEIILNSPGGPNLTSSWHATGGWTLTVGSGVTVRAATPGWFVVGSYGSTPDSIINNGTLSADSAGSTLFIATPGTLTNNGTLRATAGGVQFHNLTNSGVIQIDAGSSIGTYDTTFTNGASGIIKGSGSFFIGDFPSTGILTNSGTISPGTATTTGTLNIAGNLINNGTIQTKVGGTPTGQYDVLAVSGNATLGGTLSASTINSYLPTNLDFVPFLTTGGTSSGTFATVNKPSGFSVGYNLAANEAARLIYSAGAKTFTNAAGGLNWDNAGNWTGITLPSTTDDVLLNAGYAVNHGTGNDTIGALTINSGNALSVSGGSLSVTRNTTVGGTLTTSGGTLNLNGGLANTGTLAVSAGTLNLAGTYTPANLGNLVGTGGATRLTGTLTNAGSTLTLNNTTGNIDIVGTVTGGTLATASGSTSKYLSTSGTLDGVTLAGNLQVNPNGNMTIRNGLTLSNGKVYLGDGVTNAASGMNWDGTQTIGGSGEIILNSPGGPNLTSSWHATGGWTLTVGSGVTVRAATPGWFVVGSYGSTPDSIINNGTLSADSAGSTLFIATPGTLTNNGTLRATAGGVQFHNLTNSGVIQIDAGSSIGTYDTTFTNGASGIIKGSGSFFIGDFPSTGILTNSGTISPGTATTTGTLNIAGNLINNGTIQTKVGGTPTGQYDVLAVSGNATLGGTLSASTINSYLPTGQSFDVITAASISGSFSTSTVAVGNQSSLSVAGNKVIITTGGSIAPIPPTLSQCISNPTTTGCSIVLPTLATCSADPRTAGCSVVLPSTGTCTTAPTTAGCSVVLPSIATCMADPTVTGCTVVLPSAVTAIVATAVTATSAATVQAMDSAVTMASSTPVSSTVAVAPPATPPPTTTSTTTNALPLLPIGQTVGGSVGSFGAEPIATTPSPIGTTIPVVTSAAPSGASGSTSGAISSYGETSSSTPGTTSSTLSGDKSASETKKDEGSSTKTASATKDEKKSNDAKDGKKNQKTVTKKVAQCT